MGANRNDRGRNEVRQSHRRAETSLAETKGREAPPGREMKGVPRNMRAEAARQAREEFENVDVPRARREDVTPLARGYKAMRKAAKQLR